MARALLRVGIYIKAISTPSLEERAGEGVLGHSSNRLLLGRLPSPLIRIGSFPMDEVVVYADSYLGEVHGAIDCSGNR